MTMTRDSIADVWGPRTPHGPGADWPIRVDEQVEAPPDRCWVQAGCALCWNGCGCDIAVKDNCIVGGRGRAADMVDKGRLDPKNLNGWQANLWGTLVALSLLTALHRLLADTAARSARLSHLLEGAPISLGRGEQVKAASCIRHAVNEAGLNETPRSAGLKSVNGTRLIVLEPSGKISVLKKP
jgi:hypothetical protein